MCAVLTNIPEPVAPIEKVLEPWLESVTPSTPKILAFQGVSGIGKSKGLEEMSKRLRDCGVQSVPEGFVYLDRQRPLIISSPAGSIPPAHSGLDSWEFTLGMQRGNSFERLREGMRQRGAQQPELIAEIVYNFGFGSWRLAHRLGEYEKSYPVSERPAVYLRHAEIFLLQQVLPVRFQNPHLEIAALGAFSPLEDPSPQLDFLAKVARKHPKPEIGDLERADIAGFDEEMQRRYAKLLADFPGEPTIAITAVDLSPDDRAGVIESVVHLIRGLHCQTQKNGESELGTLPKGKHYLLYWQAGQDVRTHPDSDSEEGSRIRFCRTAEFVRLREAAPQEKEVLQFTLANHFPDRGLVLRTAVFEATLRALQVPYSMIWPQNDGLTRLLHPHVIYQWSPARGLCRAPELEGKVFCGF